MPRVGIHVGLRHRGAPTALPLDSITGTLPLFAYGIKRLRAVYAGSAFRVVRASDSTTLDVGFVGSQLDNAALATFLAGTTGAVSIWYDQSGNGNDATQTTAANRPTIQVYKIGGATSLFFNPGTGFFNLPAGLSVSSQAIDFLAVLEQISTTLTSAFVQFGSSPQNSFFNQNGHLQSTSVGAAPGFWVQGRPSLFEINGDATSKAMWQNNESVLSAGGPTLATFIGGDLGNTALSGGYVGQSYFAAAVAYGRKLSASDNAAVRGALASEFSYVEAPAGRLAWVGDSIIATSLPTSAAYYGFAMQSQALLSKPVNIYQFGVGGTQIQNALGTYATTVGSVFGEYADNRLALILYGTNDIVAGGRTAAQLSADIRTYCGKVRTSGGKAIIATILPQTGFTAPMQTIQQTVNTDIRTNWASFADGLADFANDPTMGPQAAASNTALYADGLHPTVAGHAILAPIAAAAINLLL